jgi:hypothetical protein
MRIILLLSAASLVALTGCDPGHGQALALREEFQHSLADKDKVIDTLTQKVATLEANAARAAAEPPKVDSGQIAEAVAEAVGKKLEEQNAKGLAALAAKIDRLASARPSAPPPSAAPTAPEPPDPLSQDTRVRPGSPLPKGAAKGRQAANPNPNAPPAFAPNPNPNTNADPSPDASGRTKMKMQFGN